MRGAISTLLSVALLSSVAAAAHAALPEAGEPSVEFALGKALSSTRAPLVVSWPKTAGAAGYELQHQTDGASWKAVTLSSAKATSGTVKSRPGTLNRFRLRALDASGNRGPWATGKRLWLGIAQDTDWRFTWSAGWRPRSMSSAFGGSVMRSTTAGSSARISLAGSQVAWVATRGPKLGRATVAIDGEPLATVDLYAPTRRVRRIVLTRSWPDDDVRTFAITVEGTADRPRVDVDALLTLGPASVAVIAGAGDIARCDRKSAAAAAAATGELLSALEGIVFTAGDNTQLDGTAAEFRDCFDPRWGHLKPRMRPAVGNHEYIASSRATPHFDYFGALAGPRHKGWYAYDAGTWRIYTLNSNCEFVGGCGTTSAQYKWLKADLAANPRRCVAAIWHHQRFSSGRKGPDRVMRHVYKLLYDHGAELVISGHEHHYERFAPMNPRGEHDAARGMRYFIVGTGGTTLREVTGERTPTTEALDHTTHGVLKLTLRWSAYEWEFIPVPGGEFGSFSDSGAGDCH